MINLYLETKKNKHSKDPELSEHNTNDNKAPKNHLVRKISQNIILATFNYMQRKTMMIMSLRSLLNYNGQLFALRSKQEISKKLHTYLKLFSNEGFKE